MGSLRVFLSSTFIDLAEHREVVREAVLGLEHLPDDMVLWSADPRSGSAHSVDRVRQADVLILVVAHRYGFVPDGSEHSVTELEYRAAHAAGVPVLAFFLDQSVPWPPDQVEWTARERLAEFRRLVESQVTRKSFTTPDDLSRQVVQSLVRLIREPPNRSDTCRFHHTVREAATPDRLADEPDVLLPIGLAEDGLPLLLDVRRGRDLSAPFEQLADLLGPAQRPVPQELLASFRQSLQKAGRTSWAEDGFRSVVADGGVRRMFVSSFTLSQKFASCMAGLISGPTTGHFIRTGAITIKGVARTMPELVGLGDLRAELQSSGGSNRFLAVSLDDGATSSVGWHRDGSMVEWRTFVGESVLGSFPDATVELLTRGGSVRGPLADAATFLMAALGDQPNDERARFQASMRVVVPVQGIIRLVAGIARALGELHSTGVVHADVKPHNVLLCDGGPMLIDSFHVEPGRRAPGWTPGWSAPEQMLGRPISPAADVYPLGVMLAKLLDGELVGEVRRYRTPGDVGQLGFDLLHDPSLFFERLDLDAKDATSSWRTLVERALRFDPQDRPDSMSAFADELCAVAEEHPVSGVRSFEPSGRLMAARLVDGTDAVARVIVDRAAAGDAAIPDVRPS